MPRTVKRVVWLTAGQREMVHRCAEFAVKRGDDFPGAACLRGFLDYLIETHEQQSRVPPDVKLVVSALKLPPDALPVIMSDEIVDLLVIWGNLPSAIARLAYPDPFVFRTKQEQETLQALADMLGRALFHARQRELERERQGRSIEGEEGGSVGDGVR